MMTKKIKHPKNKMQRKLIYEYKVAQGEKKASKVRRKLKQEIQAQEVQHEEAAALISY